MGVSSAGPLLVGFFGIFSIGLPLIVAGMLASLGLISALGQTRSTGQTSGRAAVAMGAGGAVLAVVVLLVGFSLTELALRCPPTGVESGTGATLPGGSYQYSCDNGKLTVTQ